jgi:hypothetical protein
MVNPEIGDPVTSLGPVGATWDNLGERLLLVTSSTTHSIPGRMHLTTFVRSSTGWQFTSDEFVGGARSSAATLTRPAVVFHDGISTGAEGDIYIYGLRPNNPDNRFELTDMLHRTINSRGRPFWVHRAMINEWSSTRSASSAVRFGSDIAWGWRMNEFFRTLENRLEISLVSSGASDAGITDFDDVSWIANQGLRQSLMNARR